MLAKTIDLTFPNFVFVRIEMFFTKIKWELAFWMCDSGECETGGDKLCIEVSVPQISPDIVHSTNT